MEAQWQFFIGLQGYNASVTRNVQALIAISSAENEFGAWLINSREKKAAASPHLVTVESQAILFLREHRSN